MTVTSRIHGASQPFLARRVKSGRVHEAAVRRVKRRTLLWALGASFAAALGLLMGALLHRWAVYAGLTRRAAMGHFAIEAFLWAGAILAVGVFLVVVVGFRREVAVEKRILRRRRDRRDLLRLIRRYESDENRRMNN